MITAADLDTQVTIQIRSTDRDSAGEVVGTWSDVATGIWANVKDLSGREITAARAVQSEAVKRVTIRWRDGITSAMRVVHKGQAMAITAPPRMVGRRQWLELDCSEGLIDG